MRACLNARAFGNEFKNCRIFLVKGFARRGRDSPLFAVVYVPSGAKETRVHWPPVRVSARAYARTKKRKGFRPGEIEGEKRSKTEKEREKVGEGRIRRTLFSRGIFG